MYRSYENPRRLEEMLKEAEKEYAKAIEDGVDLEDLIGLAEDIAELRDRVNHAWQDDEYDMDQGEPDLDL